MQLKLLALSYVYTDRGGLTTHGVRSYIITSFSYKYTYIKLIRTSIPSSLRSADQLLKATKRILRISFYLVLTFERQKSPESNKSQY